MKKISLMLVFLLGLYFLIGQEVLYLAQNPVAQPVNFCADPNILRAFRIVGVLIHVIKIVVPVVLVIVATIKLAKVIIADEDTTDAIKNIFQKIIIGIVIFFLPSLLLAIMGGVDSYSKVDSKFAKCSSCLFGPYGDVCETLIK